MSGWEWFGQAGHFCDADNCHYHLHTHIGKWCISTVGEYFPLSKKGEMEPMGGGYHYKTMVFELGEDGYPVDHMERAGQRSATRDEAQKQHMQFCFQREEGP